VFTVRCALFAAIKGTVRIPDSHIEALEDVKYRTGFNANPPKLVLGWKNRKGWDNVLKNTNVTENCWGVAIEGGVVILDPVLGNICTPKNVIRLNLTDNQLKGSIPDLLSNITTLQNLQLGHNQLKGAETCALLSLDSPWPIYTRCLQARFQMQSCRWFT
jgi:hypothetical protein